MPGSGSASPCANVSYVHRVYDPDNVNFCIVPDSGEDAVLFAAFALLVAVALTSKLSAVWVLSAGALCEALSWTVNMGRFSNAIALWLGMKPSEIFFYLFLPPLLLDSAARVDFYVFRKVMSLSLIFAFVVVVLSTFVSIPLLLYVMGLGSQGWTWVHCALFSAMLASTDAVAVSAGLKAGGAPETLAALLEGESLFNDASGLVLFDIFLKLLMEQSHPVSHPTSLLPASSPLLTSGMAGPLGGEGEGGGEGVLGRMGRAGRPGAAGLQWLQAGSAAVWAAVPAVVTQVVDQVWEVSKEFCWLAGGGLLVGLVFGFATTQVLRWLQWRRQPTHVEVTVTLGATYLCFYIANAYLEASGVIACVIFGLYGAASMTWRMSIKAKREGAMTKFWDVLSFSMNGVIFFYVGASSANFLIRLGQDVRDQGSDGSWDLFWALGLTLPLIYLSFSLLRGVLLLAAVTGARWMGIGIHISWQGVVFATVGGMRGAVSLVLAQSVLTLNAQPAAQQGSPPGNYAGVLGVAGDTEPKVIAQMGLWTAGFVVLTLVINGPLITPLMGWLKLNTTSKVKQQVQARARSALVRYTAGAIADLQAHAGDALRGVDWVAVARYVDLGRALDKVLPGKKPSAVADADGDRHAGRKELPPAAASPFWHAQGPPSGSALPKAPPELSQQRANSGLLPQDLNPGPVTNKSSTTTPLLSPMPSHHFATTQGSSTPEHMPPLADVKGPSASQAPKACVSPQGGHAKSSALDAIEARALLRLPLIGGSEMVIEEGLEGEGEEGSYAPPSPLEWAATPPSLTPRDTARNNPSPPVRHSSFGQTAALSRGATASSTGAMAATQPPSPAGARASESGTGVVGSEQDAEDITAAAAAVASILVRKSVPGAGPAQRTRADSSSLTQRQQANARHLDQQYQQMVAASENMVCYFTTGAKKLTGQQQQQQQQQQGSSGGGGEGHVVLDVQTALPSPQQLPQRQQEGGRGLLGMFSRPSYVGAAMTEDEVADTRAAYLSSKSLRPASTSSSDPASSQLPEYKEVELPNDQQLAEFVAELASTVVADAQANLAKPSLDPAAASHLATGPDSAPGSDLAVVPGQEQSSRPRRHHRPGHGRKRRDTDTSVATGGHDGISGSSLPAAACPANTNTPFAQAAGAVTSLALEHQDKSAGPQPVARVAGQGTLPTSQPDMDLGRGQEPVAATSGQFWTGKAEGGGLIAACQDQPGASESRALHPEVRHELDVHNSQSSARMPPGPGPAPAVEADHLRLELGQQRVTALNSLAGQVCPPSTASTLSLPRASRRSLDYNSYDYPATRSRGRHGRHRHSMDQSSRGIAHSMHEGSAFFSHAATTPASHLPAHGSSSTRLTRRGSAAAVLAADAAIAGGAVLLSQASAVSAEQREVEALGGLGSLALGAVCAVVLDADAAAAGPSAAGTLASSTAASAGVTAPQLAALHAGASPLADVGPGGGVEGGAVGSRSVHGGNSGRLGSGEIKSRSSPLRAHGSSRRSAFPLAPSASNSNSLPTTGVASAAASYAILSGSAVTPVADLVGPAQEVTITENYQPRAGDIAPAGLAAASGRPAFAPSPATANIAMAVTSGGPTAGLSHFVAGHGTSLHAAMDQSRLLHSLQAFASFHESRSGASSDHDHYDDGHGANSDSDALQLARAPARFGSSGGVRGSDVASSRRSGASGVSGVLSSSLTLLGIGRGPRSPGARGTASQLKQQGPSLSGPPLLQSRRSLGGAEGLTRRDLQALARIREGGSTRPARPSSALAVHELGNAVAKDDPWAALKDGWSRGGRVTSPVARGGSASLGLRAAGSPLRAALQPAGEVSAGDEPHRDKGCVSSSSSSSSSSRSKAASVRQHQDGESDSDSHSSYSSSYSSYSSSRSTASSVHTVCGSEAGSWRKARGEGGEGKAGQGPRGTRLHETLAEYRVRLLSGLKRHFHAKHTEGLLSDRGLRLLDWCCDSALDEADTPLDLWERVEQEVSGKGWVARQAGFHFRLRRVVLKLHGVPILGRWLLPPLSWLAQWLGRSLSLAMMAGVEVALEMHAALTSSPQAQWLAYAGNAGRILSKEIEQQIDKVWRYMLDREIEAPDRFQAIQTHRAAMAVLRAQQGFVEQLLGMGMIDEHERDGLNTPIERQMWKLETRGPRWKHPSLQEVLLSVPFLKACDTPMFDWLRSTGELCQYQKGSIITSDAKPCGLFIVVSGMVRITLNPGPDSTANTPGRGAGEAGEEEGEQGDASFYVGTGGVGGLTQALMGRSVPGMSIRCAIAEGNALGKGPLVFHLKPAVLSDLRARAAAGQAGFVQLELSMFRLAGLFILDRQREAAINSIVQLMMAAVARVEAHQAASHKPGPPHSSQLRRLLEAGPGQIPSTGGPLIPHTTSSDELGPDPVDGDGTKRTSFAGQNAGLLPGTRPVPPASASRMVQGRSSGTLGEADGWWRTSPPTSSFPSRSTVHKGQGGGKGAGADPAAASATRQKTPRMQEEIRRDGETDASLARASLPKLCATDTGVRMDGEGDRPSRQSLPGGRPEQKSEAGERKSEAHADHSSPPFSFEPNTSSTLAAAGAGIAAPGAAAACLPTPASGNAPHLTTAASHHQAEADSHHPRPDYDTSHHRTTDNDASHHRETDNDKSVHKSDGGAGLTTGVHQTLGHSHSKHHHHRHHRHHHHRHHHNHHQTQQQRQEAAAAARLATAAQQRLAHKCFDRAVAMYEAMKNAVKSAHLLRLAARETITQHSTMLLVNGSLVQTSPISLGSTAQEATGASPGSKGATGIGQGPAKATVAGCHTLPVFKPPGLLMWLPDFLEYGIARYFRQGEAVSFTAGPTGAVLLVCEGAELGALLEEEGVGGASDDAERGASDHSSLGGAVAYPPVPEGSTFRRRNISMKQGIHITDEDTTAGAGVRPECAPSMGAIVHETHIPALSRRASGITRRASTRWNV